MVTWQRVKQDAVRDWLFWSDTASFGVCKAALYSRVVDHLLVSIVYLKNNILFITERTWCYIYAHVAQSLLDFVCYRQ
jgi:hypothetical protein